LDHPIWRSAGLLVSVTTLVAWLLSLLVPWHRLPRWCTLAFPIFVWTALAVLGHTAQGIGGNYSGLYALWFAYLGLTQPPGTSIGMLPMAIAAYLVSWGGPSSPLIARLLIAIAVWLILGELLAALIVRQRALTDEMRMLAHVDTLTKLGNRRDLDLRLADAVAGDTVVLCDLDHFKQLNDTLGHAAGDSVLTEFGLVIRATLRKLDYAARYGGEEFALLLPDTSPAQAATLLDRLRLRWAVLHPEVTFSAGVATYQDGVSGSATLAEADRAMYAAKDAGRNRDHCSTGPLRSTPADDSAPTDESAPADSMQAGQLV
jgi:diguanylate cyclase